MIFDELENLAYYKGIHENLDCAIDYLLTHDLSNYELGRYEINGDKVFFFVQENEGPKDPWTRATCSNLCSREANCA